MSRIFIHENESTIKRYFYVRIASTYLCVMLAVESQADPFMLQFDPFRAGTQFFRDCAERSSRVHARPRAWSSGISAGRAGAGGTGWGYCRDDVFGFTAEFRPRPD
jgi:hypothetical protein